MNTKRLTYVTSLATLLGALSGCGQPADAADAGGREDGAGGREDGAVGDASPVAVEAYATLEAMGVVVDLPAGVTGADIGEVRIFLGSADGWRRVHDAAQVGDEAYFAGSVFSLVPGTSYDVRAEVYDTASQLIAEGSTSGTTWSEPELPTPGAELHVSTAGTRGAAGTLTEPMATIAEAAAAASEGTTIWVHAGTYYEGDIEFRSSGGAVDPIVLRPHDGGSVVVDGADPALVRSESWSDLGDGVYAHTFSGECRNVTLRRTGDEEDLRSYPMATAAEVQMASSEGLSFSALAIDAAHSCDGSTLTLRVPGGAIGDYEVFASRYSTGILIDGRDHIMVDGLTLTHYGQGSFGRGIYVTGSSDVLVQNCTFAYDNTGIWVKGESSRLIFQDNIAIDDTADWHFTYTKSQGVAYHDDIETGLVYIDGTFGGRGLVIRRNHISNLFDGAHIVPTYTFTGRTAEVDFYDNTIRHVADDFVEVDGIARNVRVFDNDMRESLSGISLAQALDGPTWIVRNLIIDAGICQATALEDYEGYPFKTNGGRGTDVGSGEVFFYHNTATTREPASSAILVKSGVAWRRFTLRNNIWHGRAAGFTSWSAALSRLDWDYDCLSTDAGPYASIGGTTHSTIGDLAAETGWLQNGIADPPGFADDDYHLTAGSPCRESGVVIPGINDGFGGAAPDRGAREHP